MIVIPLIERKRDGGRLAPDEWAAVIGAYASGALPDYQMAALLMASMLNGLDGTELGALTDSMCASGARLEFGPGPPPRVDKHSTGGVGDKVSLVLAPLIASAGVAVPMISGRGLSHTGGTLDKLESIAGFRTRLSLDEARRQVERVGSVLIGQSDEIAPADRKLYALRDATGTVASIPLMAASIMSKKLAEGLHGLVLDIKRGTGAFLPELADGIELARTMVKLGEERRCPTVALVTAMDRPLGHACGNAIEVREAIDALHGRGPADLTELVLRLGVEMLALGGIERDEDAARKRLESLVASGAAIAKFGEIVEAQGGDPRVLDQPDRLGIAPVVEPVTAPDDGIVQRVEPRAIGIAVVQLGGGRQRMEDTIDPLVGAVVPVKPGDVVARGQPIAFVHARDRAAARGAASRVATAIRLGESPPSGVLPLVSHRVTSRGVEVLD
jgi:pyrimidine-nucleoside phosphorylase